MRVFIVRHGKAEPVSDSGRDADRRLADRGERQAEYLAERLCGCDTPPTVVVSSDATRAKSTAERIVRKLGRDIEHDPRLRIDEPVSSVIEVIETRGRNGALCVVGHNPQLAEAIAVVTGGIGSPEVRLRTGEAWEIDLDAERPIGSGRVIAVHRLDD